jgi:Tfp pilus assembly protein PilX
VHLALPVHHLLMLRLRDQRGLALPMVIGMMMVFSISVTSVVWYSSSTERAADKQKKGQSANAAAEAALATAISALSTTTDPLSTSSLPSCASPVSVSPLPAGHSGDYCGALSGTTWTITAHGSVSAGAADTGQVRTKTITQIAEVEPFYAGGLGELWNRIYQDDSSKCTEFKKMILTIPVVTRGCLKLTGDDAHPSRLLGPYVTVGGAVTLKEQDSIGTAASPIPRADIVGTCTREHGSGVHSPCGAVDSVYASQVTTTADFTRPTVDFTYWYSNSKPGPTQGCTYGSLGTGMKFDKNTNYNRDNDPVQLTPNGVSYSCQVWSSPPNGGSKLGEISWDAVSQVLTVYGTIFFDGDVKATAPGHSKACDKADHGPYCDKSYSYNGRGVIYSSGKFEIEAGMCSGGDGSNDCETDPANWDPTQNLLIIISGGLKNLGDETFKMDKDEAVFQGAVWSQGKCKIGKKASFSAPLICGQLAIKEDDTIDDPTVNPWPASLIGSGSGQVWPSPAGAWNLFLGDQYVR